MDIFKSLSDSPGGGNPKKCSSTSDWSNLTSSFINVYSINKRPGILRTSYDGPNIMSNGPFVNLEMQNTFLYLMFICFYLPSNFSVQLRSLKRSFWNDLFQKIFRKIRFYTKYSNGSNICPILLQYVSIRASCYQVPIRLCKQCSLSLNMSNLRSVIEPLYCD